MFEKIIFFVERLTGDVLRKKQLDGAFAPFVTFKMSVFTNGLTKLNEHFGRDKYPVRLRASWDELTNLGLW